jgi:glycosyltransferase involved in cell wall biosynthesis
VQPVEVVFVLGGLTRGGTELQATALAQALAARGVGVRVIVLEALGDGTIAGVDTIRLNVRRGLWAAPDLIRAALVLRRLLKEAVPCIVHSALARAYILTALVRPRGTRHVTWRRNMGVHLQGHAVLGRFVERFAARRSDLIITNSSAAAGYWSDLLPRGTKIRVVPNSLDDRFFTDEPRPAGEGGSLSLVAVGGLKPVKNLNLIIRAVSELNRRGIKAHLTVVGGGKLRDSLVDQARIEGIRLDLPGPQEDVLPWLLSADAFVHAAVSEGCSNAVLEALATSTPVIAPDIAGMSETVGDGALLYPPGDVGAFADAIAAACADDHQRHELRDKARAVADRHREAEIVNTYQRLYEDEMTCAE